MASSAFRTYWSTKLPSASRRGEDGDTLNWTEALAGGNGPAWVVVARKEAAMPLLLGSFLLVVGVLASILVAVLVTRWALHM